jgi:hypothetical protein
VLVAVERGVGVDVAFGASVDEGIGEEIDVGKSVGVSVDVGNGVMTSAATRRVANVPTMPSPTLTPPVPFLNCE